MEPRAAGAEVTISEVAAFVPSPSGRVSVPCTVPETGPSTLLKEKLKVAALATGARVAVATVARATEYQRELLSGIADIV
ncbi:MAG: hypothetical protein ACKPKF_12035 [Microcystis panniformis]